MAGLGAKYSSKFLCEAVLCRHCLPSRESKTLGFLQDFPIDSHVKIYHKGTTKVPQMCVMFFFFGLIWQITRKKKPKQKKQQPVSPDYFAFRKVLLNLNESCESSLLKILKSGILQSAPNDPKLNSDTTSNLHMHSL